jgi:penicillin-binding protein 2
MLGDKLGIDKIAKYANEFGYGQKTGVDLPGEQGGLMPSAQWKLKNYHARWYPDETLDVSIGQGAVEATPLQLARIIGGIASGGHLVRPHVVFPDQLPENFRKALLESFPGSGDAYVPIDPENWITVTDGMADVTQPGYFHTAASAHLQGIDFGGKTGTAQLMSHEALEKTTKGRITFPNVWFVGVTPRRNPELVVAVLWQNGEFSFYPARIGAAVVSAYVEKQRRLAHNLAPTKTAAPVEMGAVWTTPDDGKPNGGSRMQGGSFLVKDGKIVAQARPAATGNASRQGLKPTPSLSAHVGVAKATPFQSSEGARAAVSGSRPAAGRPQKGDARAAGQQSASVGRGQ